MFFLDRFGNLLRSLRGWGYRTYPGWESGAHRRRLAGHGRRWDAEEEGRTWEGFCRLVWHKLLDQWKGALIFELAAGDGLVGSLGRWLEKNQGWKAECWETRAVPSAQLRRLRPMSSLHSGKIEPAISEKPSVVVSRSSRTNTILWKAIRDGSWNPELVGLWNRSGRDLWFRRMSGLGYRLALCQDRLEIYTREGSGADKEDGCRRAEDE